MENEINWGILGAGRIARKFVADMALAQGAKLAAIASTSLERARAFASEFKATHSHDSYQALAENPDVQVIYIATRNQDHARCVRLALQAGKPVLCEKPFAINAREAKELIELARQKRLFLMEAMWMRCFPLMARVRDIIANGGLGEVRMVSADFGFAGQNERESRLFNLEFGGGALLDVGVYTISLATMILGKPNHISGKAKLAETGVDEQASYTLGYPGGQLAQLACAVSLDTPKEAWIAGTRGQLKIHVPFWKPRTLTLIHPGQEPELIHDPYPGFGYQFEIQEVMNCLQNGQLESPLMPWAETLTILETMDELRRQWGVVYPMEQPQVEGRKFES